MGKLNLKKHIKGVVVSVKEAGKRRIQDYREERKEKSETRRQIRLAEREEYIKAKRDERDIHREEMLEEARERGRLRAIRDYRRPPDTKSYRTTIPEKVQHGMVIVRETQQQLGKIGKQMPTYKMMGEVRMDAPQRLRVSTRDNISDYLNPKLTSGNNMLGNVDQVLGIAHKKRVKR